MMEEEHFESNLRCIVRAVMRVRSGVSILVKFISAEISLELKKTGITSL